MASLTSMVVGIASELNTTAARLLCAPCRWARGRGTADKGYELAPAHVCRLPAEERTLAHWANRCRALHHKAMSALGLGRVKTH